MKSEIEKLFEVYAEHSGADAGDIALRNAFEAGWYAGKASSLAKMITAIATLLGMEMDVKHGSLHDGKETVN